MEEACELVGVKKPVGYIWQDRWNEEGYNGLIPRYAGGRPSKLTKEQKDKLLELLKQKDNWTTEEVRDLIHKEFNSGIYIETNKDYFKEVWHEMRQALHL